MRLVRISRVREIVLTRMLYLELADLSSQNIKKETFTSDIISRFTIVNFTAAYSAQLKLLCTTSHAVSIWGLLKLNGDTGKNQAAFK